MHFWLELTRSRRESRALPAHLHSDETLAEFGLLRPEEDQDEVKEVLDSPAHLSGGSGQGLHQRCPRRRRHVAQPSFLLRSLVHVSVLTDQVFGSSLTSLCQRENSSVPNFVKMCIDHVEKTGMMSLSTPRAQVQVPVPTRHSQVLLANSWNCR